MPTETPTKLCRIEVRPRAGRPDPRAEAVLKKARSMGYPLDRVATAKVYFVEGALSDEAIHRIKSRLLADPVVEAATAGIRPAQPEAQIVEVHPLPGVMDPTAQSVREAVRDLVGLDVNVSTGARYDFTGLDGDAAVELAQRALANPVIHDITRGPWYPESLPKGHEYKLQLTHVLIRGLSDDELAQLSRNTHLFLSLAEMKAIQAEYLKLGRDPTDIELETIAQTWSEHCVHKTLKSRVTYRNQAPGARDQIDWRNRPGHTVNPDASVTIDNLLKSTVAAATRELMADGVTWPLSVFKDNSGVVELDSDWGVCIKVETHNHPSAIEPYGGSATGAGGCIRDVIGTGLGAKPIANTDVFCVAHPDHWAQRRDEETKRRRDADADSLRHSTAPSLLPPGTLHPRRILSDAVAGVRDYGNRMGIPTVNGGVHFDDRYVGNPLVFCGCVGLIPRNLIQGKARPGDHIIALGGRTGRDGIHGATFSSAELEHTAADEFSHAVQIGNAIEEKRLLDAILRARDEEGSPLFSAITDCGAGGFSSAVGEMGGEIGAHVRLERVPLKYNGLSYTEMWISEAQERMVLAVPQANIPTLARICDEENVELADLGTFGTPGAELILDFHSTRVGQLPMHFLHEGLPTPTREAAWTSPLRPPPPEGKIGEGLARADAAADSTQRTLLRLLSHPSIASKHWIVRQYDHEVQGNTVLKPLVGPGGRGPGDAAVLEPIAGSGRGIALASGLQLAAGDPAAGGDPYHMALASIDECVRNLVCVGADPDRIAILDNFCWPSCDSPRNLGALVRACEGCYDGAKAFRTPFVSGKDSLNNQLRYEDPATGERRLIEIPCTLLISGLAIVQDIARCVTMDAKHAGSTLLLVGPPCGPAGVDLSLAPRVARAVAGLIAKGLVRAAHDCSEGGVLVAVAEMLIAGGGGEAAPLGAMLTVSPTECPPFIESQSRYILEVATADLARARAELRDIPHAVLGTLGDEPRLRWAGAQVDVAVEELAGAWLSPLDW